MNHRHRYQRRKQAEQSSGRYLQGHLHDLTLQVKVKVYWPKLVSEKLIVNTLVSTFEPSVT